MRLISMACAALFIASPVFAEKGDIYNCEFKVKRGQWLTEQVVFGVGHASGKAKVYDGMVHLAHGKPIPASFGQNDAKRMSLIWEVFVDDANGTARKLKLKLTYIKSNGKASFASRVAGYENFDTAGGRCSKSVGDV